MHLHVCLKSDEQIRYRNFKSVVSREFCIWSERSICMFVDVCVCVCLCECACAAYLFHLSSLAYRKCCNFYAYQAHLFSYFRSLSLSIIQSLTLSFGRLIRSRTLLTSECAHTNCVCVVVIT